MTAARPGAVTVVEVTTPGGPARVHVRRPRGARGTVVLGHGAGGGLKSVDITAAWSALDARQAGFDVSVVVEATAAIDLEGSRKKMLNEMRQAGIKLDAAA